MNTANWKPFFYKALFEIKKGKRLTKADMIEGSIPYIGATDSNNGITAFISNDRWLHEPNTISVSYNGSIAEAFYQDVAFWATDDVNVLYPKFELNRNRAIFLTTLINKEKFRYNYGRKWDKEVMEKSIIKLPINKEGKPDWNWIDNYIANAVIPHLPPMTASIWNKTFNTNSMFNKKNVLEVSKWRWFDLKELFKVKRGCRLAKPDRESGDTPLVTAGSQNEGIAELISNEKMIRYENAVTIDMFGFSCYRGYIFCCDDNILVLNCKQMNKFVGMFIATVINKDGYKCAYGRQYRQKTLATHKIKLPAINTGKKDESGKAIYEPDWQFMEDYIKSLPYSACL